MSYPLIFDQGIIDKCRERMPLAILGKCSLEDTLCDHLPPTIEEYREIIQSKAVNDDDSDETKNLNSLTLMDVYLRPLFLGYRNFVVNS
jgi:hypothetical protein